MVHIQNHSISQKLIDDLRVQTQTEQPPKETSDKVVLTYQVNDALFFCDPEPIVRRNVATDAVSATIYSTDPNKTFYLTGINVSLNKDASSTSIVSWVSATINGTAQILMEIQGTSLTAQSEVNSISFPFPIRIDKSTNITANNSAAVANIDFGVTIYGFLLQST